MRKYAVIGIVSILFLSCCLEPEISREPVPGDPWDFNNQDYAVCKAYNSLLVFDLKTNTYVTSTIFKGYFVSFAQADNLFYCNDAGAIGDIPSSLFVIDSNEGKCTDTVELDSGVEFLHSFNNRIYVSHGVMWQDGSQDYTIYDPATGTKDVMTADGGLVSLSAFKEIEGEICILVRNTVTQKISMYNMDRKEAVPLDPEIPYVGYWCICNCVYMNGHLYVFDYLSSEGLTHIYKYDWNTKRKVAETFIADQVSVKDVYNGLIIAVSLSVPRHASLMVLEENDDVLTEKYRSEPGSFCAEYFWRGSKLYVIDSMSYNTYDIFDFADTENITHIQGIEIPKKP